MNIFLRVVVSLVGLACIGSFLALAMPIILDSPPQGVYLEVDGHSVLDMRKDRPAGFDPDPSTKFEVLAGHKITIKTIFYSAGEGLSNLVFGASMDGTEIPIEAAISPDPKLKGAAVQFSIDIPKLPPDVQSGAAHKIRVWAVDRRGNLKSEELFSYIVPIQSNYSFRAERVNEVTVDTENIVGALIDPEAQIEAIMLRDDLNVIDEYTAVAVLTPKINPELEKERKLLEKSGKEPTPEEQEQTKMKIYEIVLGRPYLARDKKGGLAQGLIKLDRVYSDSVGRYVITFPDSIILGTGDDFDRRFLIHIVLVRKSALGAFEAALGSLERVGDIVDNPVLKGKFIMVDDCVEVHRKPKPRVPPTTTTPPAEAGKPTPPAATTTTAPPEKPKSETPKSSGSKPGPNKSSGKSGGMLDGGGKMEWK